MSAPAWELWAAMVRCDDMPGVNHDVEWLPFVWPMPPGSLHVEARAQLQEILRALDHHDPDDPSVWGPDRVARPGAPRE